MENRLASLKRNYSVCIAYRTIALNSELTNTEKERRGQTIECMTGAQKVSSSDPAIEFVRRP